LANLVFVARFTIGGSCRFWQLVQPIVANAQDCEGSAQRVEKKGRGELTSPTPLNSMPMPNIANNIHVSSPTLTRCRCATRAGDGRPTPFEVFRPNGLVPMEKPIHSRRRRDFTARLWTLLRRLFSENAGMPGCKAIV
jgi:hypothetical protein